MKLAVGVIAYAATAAAAAVVNETQTLALITDRRVLDVAQFPDPSWFPQISGWLASQKDDGTWSDVDYTSGCPAQRANWPIQQHWNRLIAFATAWGGTNPLAPKELTGDGAVWDAISRGLDYWFSNDYTEPDCVGEGGVAGFNCPCGTPGLWNTNWYDQAILIPQLVSHTCLLVKSGNLTDSQRAGCVRIPKRAYDLRDASFGTGGVLTAANVVLLMQNSVSLALFMEDSTILADAFNRAMGVMTFSDDAGEDGIHRDGTFLQHTGILYNGNYGKDLLIAFIQLNGEAIGTPLAANESTREAMSTLIRGDEWMIYTDEQTKAEHWDFNAIGRFVAFPSVDLQANADINFNVSKLAGAVADFPGSQNVSDTISRLASNGTRKLTGNKAFWAGDLMVHRRPRFVLTNKMLSTRSSNSEFTNEANPLGYHMGQGTLYSYVSGREYEDVMGAWDWNLVPGTTVALDKPALEGATVKQTGKREFVGAVSDGALGTSVEDYVDPLDGNVAYRKAWFFVDEGAVVITTDVRVNKKGPVVSVLDNRAGTSGKVYVDGRVVKPSGGVKARTLYYGGNGYLAYKEAMELTISNGMRTGNWSAISTSTVGESSVPVFSAYATHPRNCDLAYAVFPATTQAKLAAEARRPTWTPITREGVTGVSGPDRVSLVFWPGGASSIKLRALGTTLEFTSRQPAAYLLQRKGGSMVVTLADPTQKLREVSFSVGGRGGMRRVDVEMPGGGMAGSSVQREMRFDF